MRLFDYIKLGFGFYVGYEIAKSVNETLAEVYPMIKDRIKKGYC